MEPVRPCRIAEISDRFLRVVPFHARRVAGRPRDVGEQHPAVILHDVDLAVGRPAALHAKGPECRPQTGARVDLRAHLESTESPLSQPARRHARGRELCVRPSGSPVGALRLVRRVRPALAPRLDDQPSALAPGVLRLIPLELLVSHEPGLVGPAARVGSAVTLELVRPVQLVCGGCGAGRQERDGS